MHGTGEISWPFKLIIIKHYCCVRPKYIIQYFKKVPQGLMSLFIWVNTDWRSWMNVWIKRAWCVLWPLTHWRHWSCSCDIELLIFKIILRIDILSISYAIFLFHNDFPLAVSSLNNANYLIHYNNQLTVVEQYFANICAIQNKGRQKKRAVFHYNIHPILI